MNLTDQTVKWSFYIPAKILSSAPENRKGNLTSNNLRDFFSQHFVPRSTTHWTALATSAFRSLSERLPLEETASWDSAVYTLRGHETGLFQWSIILCDFCFWQEFVFDEMLFNLLLFLVLFLVSDLIRIRFRKNGTRFPRVL